MAQIIVYYSRTGGNYVNGTIENLSIGNTARAAKMIQKETKAAMFSIEQVVPYSTDYNACIAQAQSDQRRDARPELQQYPENLEQYDTIYLGYPNYWGTMPMAVFTFLEHFDFSGKTILPFCTHEGSGMGNSEKDIKRMCPGAIVKKGLAIKGAAIQNTPTAAEEAIRRWLLEVEVYPAKSK